MLFNSVEFLVFHVIVVAIYFALPPPRRWMPLLVASYWFYMSWEPEYAILLLFSTVVSFVSAIALESARIAGARRGWMWFGIGTCLAVLVGFKYLDFLSESVEATLRAFSLQIDLPVFHILLPVGISFYTFQKIGYLVDVYR